MFSNLSYHLLKYEFRVSDDSVVNYVTGVYVPFVDVTLYDDLSFATEIMFEVSRCKALPYTEY